MITSIKDKAEQARHASLGMASLSSEQKNKVLLAIAKALDNERVKIISANEKDVEAAKKAEIRFSITKAVVFDR